MNTKETQTKNSIARNCKDDSQKEPLTEYGTSATNGMLDRWLLESQNIASVCIGGLYDGFQSLAQHVTIVDLDGSFESEQAAREWIEWHYDLPYMWVEEFADIDLSYSGGERYVHSSDVLTVECTSVSTWYEEHTATAHLMCRFDRDAHTITVLEAVIEIEVQDYDYL